MELVMTILESLSIAFFYDQAAKWETCPHSADTFNSHSFQLHIRWEERDGGIAAEQESASFFLFLGARKSEGEIRVSENSV